MIYLDLGIKKKKVMKMNKFVDKMDGLLDDYSEKGSIDVLESMIEKIEDEIDKRKNDTTLAEIQSID